MSEKFPYVYHMQDGYSVACQSLDAAILGVLYNASIGLKEREPGHISMGSVLRLPQTEGENRRTIATLTWRSDLILNPQNFNHRLIK